MIRKYLVTLVCACLPLIPARASACAGHLYFNPEEMGFLGGAVVRMVGLAPPKPTFELQHPAMVKAVIGEKSEVVVNYARPFFSKDVRLELQGSVNVHLQEEVIQLEEREGSVSISYTVVDSGFDSILLTVVGQHKGETVRQIGQIYISPRDKPSEQEMRVSER